MLTYRTIHNDLKGTVIMKLTYVFSLLLITMFLNACGPSAEEKRRIEQETALVTCSILGEPSNMSAAIRVEKMNDAREKIGGEPFLRGDDAIQEALEWGLCQELVLNEFYDETLQPLKDAKRERIAAEKRAEEQRIAAFLPEGEAEDKLLKEFHRLWLAFDYMDACHKARTGYASVYITDSKFKEITSKYTTKRASFIKQSRTLSALEESGKLDEVYKKKSTNPMIGGTPGDLIRMGSGSWNQTLKEACDNYIWFFYG